MWGPELAKTLLAIKTTPESLGTHTFTTVWELANRDSPLTEGELALGRKYPYFGKILENEFYALPNALKALKLPTEQEKRRQDLTDFEKVFGPESDKAKEYRRMVKDLEAFEKRMEQAKRSESRKKET